MDQGDRADHDAKNSEGGQPGQQTEKEGDPPKKLGKTNGVGDDGRHSHFGKGMNGSHETISSEPTEHLLRAVHEKDNSEDDSDDRQGIILVSLHR